MNAASQRAQIARIAANERWAMESDRTAATQAARDARLAQFEAKVDPDGKLSPIERRSRALLARKAHMQRIALRSAQARASRRAA